MLPVRNEITWRLRQVTREGNWYRTVNTTPVLYTEDEPVTSEQHKKSTPAGKHMFLFSLQQSSHFRHRYYLFLSKSPFPVSASLTWSSESPESGSYSFLLLFAPKISLEVLCACVCVCFVSLASCCWYFFPFLFSGLRCTQIQQRNQKQEDCGMQICQCAIQLVYCYKWNTSSLVRKRKCQVLKGQPDSSWCSIPDRFFWIQVYLFFLTYRWVKLEGISWFSKLYRLSLLILPWAENGSYGRKFLSVFLFSLH